MQSDVTSAAFGYRTSLSTQASAFTLTDLRHFSANQSTIGATSVVTTQTGFHVPGNLTGATNNYGFYSNIASAANRYNFYAAGTADNYFAGKVGIGSVAGASASVNITNNLTGATATSAVITNGAVQSDVTVQANYFNTSVATQAAAFTLTDLRHYNAAQSTIGATSAVTNQYGFAAQSNITGATNNYGVYSNIASAANRYNFYAAGTAPNVFTGDTYVVAKAFAQSSTAIPAGGVQAIGVSSTTTMGVYFGSGAPTVSAAKGSLYLRSDGSTVSDRMYVNTNGSTTWTAVTTSA